MPGIASANRIHPLCYEHHCEMKLNGSSSCEDGLDYACDEPDCLVHYSGSEGYFLNSRDPVRIKRCPIPPHQYCSKDRYPMYLLEVQPNHPSFRLWRCPKCNMTRCSGTLI